MDELTSTFVSESRDQLTLMEDCLLRLERSADPADDLGAIFRAAHTIKGGAGVVECRYLERFTHTVENVLDRLRNGEIAVCGELATLLLECCDHLGNLLDVLASAQGEPAAELDAAGARLQDRLAAYCGHDGDGPARATPPAEVALDITTSGGGAISDDAWHISIRFGRDVLRMGMDPLSFLHYLATLGEILTLDTIVDALPEAADMDPESCYLGFEIRLQTRASKADIERVFEFCRDDCTLHILPPESKADEYIQLIQVLPEDALRLGEILVRSGALTQGELDEGLALQVGIQAESEISRPLGEILVGQHVVRKEVVDAAVTKQAATSEKRAAEARMVRVNAEKLDQLIDLVGELVIAGASAHLQAMGSGRSEMVEATTVLSRLVESIRDAALQLRMVQIGETFSRFNRVVRDNARELGKEIELVIRGAETELDKSVVEKLGDPLMHLVRNAIDHGIEGAAVRASRGKPERGTVTLNAFHDSGSIVIEVSDDGGGLDTDRIRRKAIDNGLITVDAALSDAELHNLIFEAGFSTAEHVTNLSGRGVGMDVVRRNIQSLRGTIEVFSSLGAGSTFRIRLPLTLAIIDGFLVGVGASTYVIPLDAVVECIESGEVEAGGNYLNLRGEVLPFIRLRELFSIGGEPPVRQNVVIVQFAGQKAGFVVDRLLGEFQTVIKPLGALFSRLQGIGGSTILGSGEVALIVDVPALVRLVSHTEEKRLSAPAGRNTCITN